MCWAFCTNWCGRQKLYGLKREGVVNNTHIIERMFALLLGLSQGSKSKIEIVLKIVLQCDLFTFIWNP